MITNIYMADWKQEVLVWRLLTDPPLPVVKARILRTIRMPRSEMMWRPRCVLHALHITNETSLCQLWWWGGLLRGLVQFTG
jgi:hypothetical protein